MPITSWVGGSDDHAPTTRPPKRANDVRVVVARTEEHRDVRRKCGSELCKNCVRSPQNRRQTPTFTSTYQEALCGGKWLNRLRKELFRYHSLSVAGFVFQACLIDRSSISPSLESYT